jgi:hypothetical protein
VRLRSASKVDIGEERCNDGRSRGCRDRGGSAGGNQRHRAACGRLAPPAPCAERQLATLLSRGSFGCRRSAPRTRVRSCGRPTLLVRQPPARRSGRRPVVEGMLTAVKSSAHEAKSAG